MKLPAVLCAVGCILLSSCDLYYSTIYIDNRSSGDLVEVGLVNGDRRYRLGVIHRGRSKSFWRHFSGEGEPTIYVSTGSTTMHKELCYYTGPHTFYATVVVTDTGIDVRCDYT